MKITSVLDPKFPNGDKNRTMKSNNWIDTLIDTTAEIICLVISGLIMAYPVVWFWNGLVPDITKGAVTELGYWQSFRLYILVSILLESSKILIKRK